MLRHTGYVLLFCGMFSSAGAVSMVSRVVPGIPTENDSIVVRGMFSVPRGCEFLKSSVERSMDTIRAAVSYSRNCGEETPCPSGTMTCDTAIGIGRLPPGEYTLLCTVIAIDMEFCTLNPCGPPVADSVSDTISFSVASSSQQVPVLAGFYLFSGSGMVSGAGFPVKSYRYTNGDTLSLALRHTADCCAEYEPHLAGAGDTLIVVLRTTGDLCDCGSRQFHATAAITNIPAIYRHARFQSFWVSGGSYYEQTTVDLDTLTPSVCINMNDSSSAGYRLFLDTSWTTYEIVAPLLRAAEWLRIQPGSGGAVSSSRSYLYLDSITSTDGLTEGFDEDNLSDWTVNRSWNGVLLEPQRRAHENGHLLELGYADLGGNGTTTDMFRKRSAHESYVATRLPLLMHLKASCQRPAGTAVVERQRAVSVRPMTSGNGFTLVVDLRGRVVRREHGGRSGMTPVDGDGIFLTAHQGRLVPFVAIGTQKRQTR